MQDDNSPTMIAVAAAKVAAEYEMYQQMGEALQQGWSFTQWLHQFNGGRGEDTSDSGESLSGSRNYAGSKWTRMWEEAAGAIGRQAPFLSVELEHLEKVRGSFDPGPTVEQGPLQLSRAKCRAFLWAAGSERVQIIADAHECIHRAIMAADAGLPLAPTEQAVERLRLKYGGGRRRREACCHCTFRTAPQRCVE